MRNSDIYRMLSPLVFFVFHVVYLVFVSKDNFLNKWIDGSFTFFVALVLCNVIRSRLVARDQEHAAAEEGDGEDRPEKG